MNKTNLFPKTITSISLFILFLLCIESIPAHTFAQETGHYHLLKQYPIGGEGGYDYLAFDNKAGRVFISHATHVVVFDVNAEKIVGDIPNTEGVHGIAFAQEFNHGFTSNGKTNTVLMFDLKTLDSLKRIPVGEKPDAIIYDSFSKCILACCGNSNGVSVIDAATGTVKTLIPLGGAPEFAVSNDKGHVYINLEDKNEVVGVDMKTFNVVRRMKLAPGESPTGLAMDEKTNRLFSGCANECMVILNVEKGKVVGTFPIGKRVDAVVFDSEKKVAISSNGDGTLTVVREITPDKFEVAETVKTQVGARTETLDPKTHNLYLVTADFSPAPEATKEQPHPRPTLIPNTMRLLKYGY